MGHYQIHDLEQLSGIKAHTIRIWEKRYGLLQPGRTDTNIRYYDDDQVKRLLNITTLVRAGRKISHIAALDNITLKAEVLELTSAATANLTTEGLINELILAMLSYDEASFDKTWSAAVAQMGLYETMLQVCYPFLNKTGVLWCVDTAIPAQEHFASGLIRRKIMAAIDQLPALLDNKEQLFLLFLPPGEWHEISLLFADYLLRVRGLRSVNLGQNVPFENLEHVIRKTMPTHILFFLITSDHRTDTERFLQYMHVYYPGIQVLLTGNVYQIENLQLPANVQVLKDPAGLNDLII